MATVSPRNYWQEDRTRPWQFPTFIVGTDGASHGIHLHVLADQTQHDLGATDLPKNEIKFWVPEGSWNEWAIWHCLKQPERNMQPKNQYSWIVHQLDIGTTYIRHNCCCRGPISNPRLVLDSSSKITRGMIIGFFVKPQNMPVWLGAAFWCFPGFFRQNIGPLSSTSIFTESNDCTQFMWVNLVCAYTFSTISQEIVVSY